MRMYKQHNGIKGFIIVQICILLLGGISFASANEVLDSQIREKNQELQEIQQQILQQQQLLEQTQREKRTVESELSRVNAQIRQIDLGIRSSRLTIDKLDLEIASLQEELVRAQESINQKAETVTDVLRQVQERDTDSMLVVLLKHDSLSESLFEIQALRDLNISLLGQISELEEAQRNLSRVLEDATQARRGKTIEQTTLENKRVISEELQGEKKQILSLTKSQEQEFEKNLSELEERQLEIAQEIVEIESRLQNQIDFTTLPEKLPGLLANPVPERYTITQLYGRTPDAVRFYKSGFHNGIDLAAPVGTKIVAAEDGVVLAAADQDLYCRRGAYGKFVLIQHPTLGLATLYAHLSYISVKKGDIVKRGDLIGNMGNTGLSTGSHLHFTLYDAATVEVKASQYCGPEMPYGGSIDPRNYVLF